MSLALTGIIFMVMLEQMTTVAIENIEKYPKLESIATETENLDINTKPENLAIDKLEKISNENTQSLKSGDDYLRLFMKLVIFECSITLHSVIIGFDLGILNDDNILTIKTLMIALGFHQFFEGFSLGTMIASIPKLSPIAVFIYVIYVTIRR